MRRVHERADGCCSFAISQTLPCHLFVGDLAESAPKSSMA